MSCGVGRRCGLDLAWLWLGDRPAATVPIQPLAWEPPYAVTLKRQKKKKGSVLKKYKSIFLKEEVGGDKATTRKGEPINIITERLQLPLPIGTCNKAKQIHQLKHLQSLIKQNKCKIFTNLRVSEILFHRIIFGVAYCSHPLNTLISCLDCNLPKTSSKSHIKTSYLMHYKHLWNILNNT